MATARKPTERLLTALLIATLATPAVQAACLGMQVHAHRGADSAPENSLAALRAGYGGGWDGVETDMQPLGDSAWVIHHDAVTGRVVQAGPPQTVRALRSADWRNAGMKLRGTATGEAPPFVADATALASGFPTRTLNAEIKAIAACTEVNQLTAQMAREIGHGNWFITSAIEVNLRCARQTDHDGYLGLIVLDPRNAEAAGSNGITRAIARRAQAPRLDRGWLARLKQSVGMPVGVHVDARTLDDNAALLADAAALDMPVFVYAVDGDTALASAVKRARQRTGYWPTGVIVDGGADSFCARIK